MATDAKRTLRDNVLAIMDWRYEGKNLLRMSKDTGIALASVQRLVEGRTSVGVEIVERLAHAYGLETWHLLVPHLNPIDPPVTISRRERQLLATVERLSAK